MKNSEILRLLKDLYHQGRIRLPDQFFRGYLVTEGQKDNLLASYGLSWLKTEGLEVGDPVTRLVIKQFSSHPRTPPTPEEIALAMNPSGRKDYILTVEPTCVLPGQEFEIKWQVPEIPSSQPLAQKELSFTIYQGDTRLLACGRYPWGNGSFKLSLPKDTLPGRYEVRCRLWLKDEVVATAPLEVVAPAADSAAETLPATIIQIKPDKFPPGAKPLVTWAIPEELFSSACRAVVFYAGKELIGYRLDKPFDADTIEIEEAAEKGTYELRLMAGEKMLAKTFFEIIVSSSPEETSPPASTPNELVEELVTPEVPTTPLSTGEEAARPEQETVLVPEAEPVAKQEPEPIPCDEARLKALNILAEQLNQRALKARNELTELERQVAALEGRMEKSRQMLRRLKADLEAPQETPPSFMARPEVKLPFRQVLGIVILAVVVETVVVAAGVAAFLYFF